MHRICEKYLFTVFITVIFLAFPSTGRAEEIPFIPPVYNYTTGDYKSGNQNWTISQGRNGIIYIGNNNGLISFDGVNWNHHALPNNLSVKSIYIDSDSTTERIYVGSFEEFGYFERDRTNQLIYHSLKSLVDGYEFHNDEIWKICPFENKIYFQSFSAFFVYEGEKVSTYKPYPAVLYFFPSGDNLFAQLINDDFSRFDGEKFHPVVKRAELNDDNVVAVLPFNEDYLLVTSKNGLYIYSEKNSSLVPWKTAIETDLQQAIVNRAIFPGFHSVRAHYGVKTERYKLICFYKEKLWELYDLQNDPQEIDNIYGRRGTAMITRELKKELERLRTLYDLPEEPQ